MNRFVVFSLAFALLFAACAAPAVSTPAPVLPAATQALSAIPVSTMLPQPVHLVIFADASLTNAFTQMAANVQGRHQGLVLDITYGDSRALRAQIEQGAHVDIFAGSAEDVQALEAAGSVSAGSASVILVNQLAILLPGLNTAGLSTLQDLAKPGLKLSLADPNTTLGQASQQLLQNLEQTQGAGYKDSLLKMSTYEQDPARVLDNIQLGKMDAGIVFISDLTGSPQLQQIKIPPESNLTLQYSLAQLAKAPQPDMARIFIDYALSEDGQNILARWGFLQDR